MSAAPGLPLDLTAGEGRAVLWGMASDDLNVNLVAWPAGEGIDEHRNDEVDVLLVVVTGEMGVRIDGRTERVGEGQAILLPRGTVRAITAGAGGVRYLSAHRRRRPLDVT